MSYDDVGDPDAPGELLRSFDGEFASLMHLRSAALAPRASPLFLCVPPQPRTKIATIPNFIEWRRVLTNIMGCT